MSDSEAEERPVRFEIQVPDALQLGVYANGAFVWHTPYEFTLDFVVLQPPQPEDPEDDQSPVVVLCPVVARVKIPPTVIFDILRAVSENMTRYESSYGEIKRPERPDESR